MSKIWKRIPDQRWALLSDQLFGNVFALLQRVDRSTVSFISREESGFCAVIRCTHVMQCCAWDKKSGFHFYPSSIGDNCSAQMQIAERSINVLRKAWFLAEAELEACNLEFGRDPAGVVRLIDIGDWEIRHMGSLLNLNHTGDIDREALITALGTAVELSGCFEHFVPVP